MALINKETGEYIKVDGFTLKDKAVKVKIYKDKPARENTTKYDAILELTHYVNDELDINALADNAKTIEENVLIACYNALKVSVYTTENFNNDL